MGKAIDEVMEGYKETELGVLPQDWELVRLGEVALVTAGGSAPQGDHFFGGKNPFIRVQHIDEVISRVSGWNLITDEAVAKYSLRLFPRGTIIFPKSGASIRLEKRAILPVDAYIVSHLCAVLPDVQKVHDIFLFHTLRFVRFAESKAEGYPTLSLSEIKETLIPLPPLPEQCKIAHILSTIQRVIELQDRIIAAARELKKSLMCHFFTYGPVPMDQIDSMSLKETEIGPVPEQWEVIRLGEITKIRSEGIDPKDNPYLKYIGLEHLDPGQIYIQRWGTGREVKSLKSLFYPGDILYGKLRPYLDKVALARWIGMCSTDILVIIPGEKVVPLYI